MATGSTADVRGLLEHSWPGAVLIDGSWLHDFERDLEWNAAGAGGSAWNERRYRSASTGFVVTALVRAFDSNSLEWRSELSYSGDDASPVLTGIRSLDFLLERNGQETLLTTNGSQCLPDDFAVSISELDAEGSVHLEPNGGRSSDGVFPFFSVESGAGAYAVGIGWSGQWAADIESSEDGIRVAVGLASPRLHLRPGEAITLPTVLLAAAEGGHSAASNDVRRILRAHVVPRKPDGSTVNPIAHMTMASFHVTHEISEASELAAVERSADLGIEAFWVDACWYGDSPDWSGQVGSWEIRRTDFPRGLRPIRDRANELGLRFVFWMEPERARTGSVWAKQHPGYFLFFPDDPGSLAFQQSRDEGAPVSELAGNLLLDLGNPEALKLAVSTVSAYITEFGADVYRQDFNIPPLAAWAAADEPDRRGMTEIRYIEGLYSFWDQLLELHPGLVIDNCASGGRRIDLETLHRSIPLWRSDSADVGGGVTGELVNTASQVQVSGLGRWIPDHSGPIKTFDSYAIRSALATGFVVYRPLPTEKQEIDDLRAAESEIQRLRPAMEGDYFVLQEPSLELTSWTAFQYHLETPGSGFAIALKKSQAADDSLILDLRGLQDAEQYRVTVSDGYERGEGVSMSGRDLAALRVSVPEEQGGILVEYSLVAR